MSFFLSCLQRPLKTIAIKSGDVYIPRGVSVPALDKDALWHFKPEKLGKVFCILQGGGGGLPFVILFHLACSARHSKIISYYHYAAGVGDIITGGDLYAVSYHEF